MKRWLPVLVVSWLVCAQDRPVAIVVGAERRSTAAAGRRIHGALLEHIGQQMDTMWAQLLQDNSFEGLRPFSAQSENWAEGKIDSSRFWWHSGYELHPWRAFGTGTGATVSTSFATNIMHGMHAKVVANKGDRPAGIAQDGVPLRAGMSYRFTGYLSPSARNRRAGSGARVTVGLYADAGLTKPYASQTIVVKSPGFQQYAAELRAPETNQDATFALAVEPGGYAAADLVSLMPADNVSGWRADVVRALQDMGLASFRYPGGCFASFIDWETMVGPPEQRLPFTNPFWGGLEPNQVGTDEFLRLAKLVGAEPLMCVNMITGAPERAAAWVEYCNGSERTFWGGKRARNGNTQPYGVTYWELDNETQRRFSAAQYAEQCRRYSAAMKAADPNVRLMAVAYFWSDEDLDLLVREAAPAIDLLAVRTVDRGELAKLRNLAQRYSTPNHRLQIAATEWRNKFRQDPWTPLRLEGSLRKAEAAWGYAIESARTLNEFQRNADWLPMAMFPTVSNLYGEDLMRIGKSGIVYTGTGRVVKLMSDMRGQVLAVRSEGGAPGQKLDFNALVDEAGRRIVCTLVHGGAASLPVRLDARAWPGAASRAEVVTLSAPSLETRADFRNPEAIRESQATVDAKSGGYALTLPPYSVSKVTLRLP